MLGLVMIAVWNVDDGSGGSDYGTAIVAVMMVVKIMMMSMSMIMMLAMIMNCAGDVDRHDCD